jgi:hypothetical protein
MAANVLNSGWVIEVSVYVVRAFVRLRQMLQANADLARKFAAVKEKYDAQFKVLFDAIRATESRESCRASRFTPHALRPAGHRLPGRG